MYYRRNGDTISVRLSIGEDIVTSLLELGEKENIGFAQVNGIGAVSRATVGFYNLDKGEYMPKTFDEPMEIVSLLGNMTRKDGKPYLHLHASFSGEDCNVVGGHLTEAIIGVTAEIFVNIIDGEMNRRVHPVTGINIFDI